MKDFLTKVLYILGDRKKSLLTLILVFIATSMLEAFGIGLIGPFLSIASNPEIVRETDTLSQIFELSQFGSERNFVAFVGFIIIILFFVKAIAYFAGKFYTFQYSFDQKKILVSRLLKTYLKVPYTFHLNKNTATIIKTTVLETNQFCNLCLLPLLEIVSNLIVVTSLIVVLFITDSILLTLILAVLFPVVLLFFILSKSFRKWGQEMSEAQQGMIRTLNHSLGGLKETRVIGCEQYFEEEIDQYSASYAKAATFSNSLQLLPRTVVEAVLITFLIALTCIVLLSFERNFENFIANMGVFAVAAMRLIPSISLVMQSFAKLRKSGYAIDMLYFDLKEIEKSGYQKLDAKSKGSYDIADKLSIASFKKESTLPFENNLKIENVTYFYPNSDEAAVTDLSLKINKGESIAFVGKSGAGKTTVVDVILGLLTPQSGDILVDGTSIYQNIRAWQNLLGYIPQSIFLLDDTIEHNIAFGVPYNQIDQNRLWKAIQMAQLEELVKELPDGIATSVGERGVRLSGGQRQRIGIARALYHEREILVLDEATSALDNETEKLISDSINQLSGNKTLIIIAHRLSTVEKCNSVYLMEKGKIIKAGTFEAVVGRS